MDEKILQIIPAHPRVLTSGGKRQAEGGSGQVIGWALAEGDGTTEVRGIEIGGDGRLRLSDPDAIFEYRPLR